MGEYILSLKKGWSFQYNKCSRCLWTLVY